MVKWKICWVSKIRKLTKYNLRQDGKQVTKIDKDVYLSMLLLYLPASSLLNL